MTLRYITSACVEVEHGGHRVLCDPWLTDGIYYGSWFHYPPLDTLPEHLAGVDYIYISHVHPDHLDPATLVRLPKTIPVLIHDYADKFVLRILHELGFERVVEVPHGGGCRWARTSASEYSRATAVSPPCAAGSFYAVRHRIRVSVLATCATSCRRRSMPYENGDQVQEAGSLDLLDRLRAAHGRMHVRWSGSTIGRPGESISIRATRICTRSRLMM